ncbi:hypothetical protein ACLKA6_005895 [Drosophila palustris]
MALNATPPTSRIFNLEQEPEQELEKRQEQQAMEARLTSSISALCPFDKTSAQQTAAEQTLKPWSCNRSHLGRTDGRAFHGPHANKA